MDSTLPNEQTYPARKALKGKLVTRMQYANWMMPENIRKTRKASTNLRRSEVCSLYAFQSVPTASVVTGLELAFGGIMILEDVDVEGSELLCHVTLL